MKKYYVVIDDEQKGPFTIEELRDKEISMTTLVWTEELNDWIEARKIEELKFLFKKTPPPILKKTDKIYKVEAEITKKTEKLIKPETEVATAKEIKTNFKMIIYALIIGIVSFPIIFAIDDGFAHMNIYSKWKEHYARPSFNYDTATKEEAEIEHNKWETLENESKRLGWSYDYTGYSYTLAYNFHKDKYEVAAKNAIWPSIFTAIIASFVLILGRYFTKGVIWVKNTSKKEL